MRSRMPGYNGDINVKGVRRPASSFRPFFAGAAVAIVAACSGGTKTLAPALTSRALLFHEDSAYYVTQVINACTLSGQLYCFEWQRETGDFTGTFSSSSVGAATITIGGKEFRATGFHADSLQNVFYRPPGECGSVSVRARFGNDQLVGTMEHQIDCHGQKRVGSFRTE